MYIHGCVISLYILYSTLLYCVHLNGGAVNDVNDEPPFSNRSHPSPFQYYMNRCTQALGGGTARKNTRCAAG